MVKVATDSTADIPVEAAKNLGITVVPAYLVFGKKSYRDGVDISKDEFYKKLVGRDIHPTTSTATPEEFAQVYRKLSEGGNEIISLHLSPHFSRIHESALQGKELVKNEKPEVKIEVVDTRLVVMAMGFLVIFAAKLAAEGKKLSEIVLAVREAIPSIHFLAVLDTLKYLEAGGRAKKAIGQGITSLLNVKMLLSIRDGEIIRAGMVRAPKKIERLIEFVKRYPAAKEAAIEYSTTLKEAELIERQVRVILPEATVYLSQVTPVIGAHTGPGILIVSLRV